MYEASVKDPAAFWHGIATKELYWSKTPSSDADKVLKWSFDTADGKAPEVAWFADGETNICYNALDRHVEAGHGDRMAFIAERNDPAENTTAPQPEFYTYGQALAEVCRIANALKEFGVKQGDRVALSLSLSLYIYINLSLYKHIYIYVCMYICIYVCSTVAVWSGQA